MRKLLEFKDGEIIWNLGDEISIVYLLVIGDESYVGTTYQPRNRLNCHLGSLLKGKHQNPLIQNKFDETGSFIVYLLEDCRGDINRFEREKYYIYKLQPTLNQEYYYKSWSFANMTKSEMLDLMCKIVRKVRLRTGYKFKGIEALTGIDWHLVSKFEKGCVELSIDEILLIFDILNINVYESNGCFYMTYCKQYNKR